MWYAVLQEIEKLHEPVGDDELRARWEDFRTRVVASAPPPYHLNRILSELGEMRAGRAPAEIAILDHGCGPGSTLTWLAALGYTNIRGVDVGGEFGPQNRVARLCWGAAEDVFRSYDGHRLPFGDRSFDLVISQQVLEHVPDDQFESYYAEEGRVLKPGGRALHQVPHRLAPYDSHTRTWGLHLLPQGLCVRAARLLGTEWPDHLHLRWPWLHRRMAEHHIGPCVNISAERLQQLQDFGYYDGPARLRRILASVCSLPVVGPAIASLATQVVLLETKTVRRA